MIGKVFKNGLLLLMVCLCAVSFAGCSDMPGKKEIKRILSQTDPYIKAELAPALGLAEEDLTISEGHVAYSRAAEYKFTVGDKTYTAKVSVIGTEIMAFTDYYCNEFYEKISGPVYDYIKDADFFVGCEYTTCRFLFSVKPPEWENPREQQIHGMLPLDVNPDNMTEYINDPETSGLNLEVEFYYYGPKDKVLSDEACCKFAEVFPPSQSLYVTINHYATQNTLDPVNFLENYAFVAGATGVFHEEYTYHTVADGITFRFNGPVSHDFKAFIKEDSLFIVVPASMECECTLFLSESLISYNRKYYEIITDSNGDNKQFEKTWFKYTDSLRLSKDHGYRIPLNYE